MTLNKTLLFTLALSSLIACGDDDAPDDAAVDMTADNNVSDDMTVGEDMTVPDAEPEMCSEEGMTRIGECGMCGSRSETCVSGEWSSNSECLNQGDCLLGDVQTEDTPLCGKRQRLCGDGCMWGEWSQVEPDQECTPGDTRDGVCGTGCYAT